MSAFKHKETQTATFSVAESPNRGLVSTHTHTSTHTGGWRGAARRSDWNVSKPPIHGRNNYHKINVLTARIDRIKTPTLL